MKRKIAETKVFSKAVDRLIKKNQLSEKDFDEFKKTLSENPEMGDVVVGTGGSTQSTTQVCITRQKWWI
jgi:hypothetical protein